MAAWKLLGTSRSNGTEKRSSAIAAPMICNNSSASSIGQNSELGSGLPENMGPDLWWLPGGHMPREKIPSFLVFSSWQNR